MNEVRERVAAAIGSDAAATGTTAVVDVNDEIRVI